MSGLEINSPVQIRNFRCSEHTPCQSDSDQHNTDDIIACEAESKENFEVWKVGKQKEICCLNEQVCIGCY